MLDFIEKINPKQLLKKPPQGALSITTKTKIIMVEFIFTDKFQNEVMVNIEKDGTIIGIYTYQDNNVHHEIDELNTSQDISTKWKIGKNSLFKHCAKNQFKNTIQKIFNNSNIFYIIMEEDFLKENSEYMENMFLIYKILGNFRDHIL